jgi:hypothetical protein
MELAHPHRPYPAPVHLVFGIYALCFLGAGFSHLGDIWLGGLLPYTWAPLAINAYWASLAVFDLLVVVLLYTHPRAGMMLALAIMLSDVAVNSYVAYGLNYPERALELHLQLQTLFLGFVLGTVPFVWMRLAEHSSRSVSDV